MAKKALVEKANRTPKFKVRGYTTLPAVWTLASCLPQVQAVPPVPAGAGARGRAARHDEGELVIR